LTTTIWSGLGEITIGASLKKLLILATFYRFKEKLWEHLSGLAHLISSIALNKTITYGIIIKQEDNPPIERRKK
jgi:hypothetical protein